MESSFSRRIGAGTLTIESGRLAQQANGAVLVRYGDTVVLVTATMSKPREGIDFFPLTIDLEERLYARGKIPGSFFRREGRPSTHSTLIARLTDRSLRPLFPDGFRNEIQVIITPLSSDQENPFDILALIGASAALSISDIPFEGPISATRIGYADGEFLVNPTYEQMESSKLDLLVAGSRDGVIMMEAGASEVSEQVVLEAIKHAQEVNMEVLALQEEAISSLGVPKVAFDPNAYPEELGRQMTDALNGQLASALGSSSNKDDQEAQLDALKAELVDKFDKEFSGGEIKKAFEALLEKEFRVRLLAGGTRPDGRDLKDIRPISCDVGLLPRTHGTGLFNRGETQVLAVATLGSVGDAQKLDTLAPEESKRFMLHYNFPPYSVGETRRVGSPGRREIGHGALAEKALSPVIPPAETFPYTLRVVSECLGSNGSTSMGSVCASTLALMDAGVPIKTPIAGISVGLVTGDNGRYVLLTDIQGLEDHVGDMDCKVAGSRDGITAIQLDIKVKSISLDIIEQALEQAREARLFILDKIHDAISEVRTELSPYAPRLVRVTIPVDKIGMVIGPGGKTIRGIVEATGATVDVENDGTVTIGAADGDASDLAVKMVKDLVREIQRGEIFTGKVVKIMNFGAFVELTPGKDGMVHISELADYHVKAVEDIVQLGEEITVLVLDVDPTGRIKLSRRALLKDTNNEEDGDGSNSNPLSSPPRTGSESGVRQIEASPHRPGGGRPGGNRGGYRQDGQRGGTSRGCPKSGVGRTFNRQVLQ